MADFRALTIQGGSLDRINDNQGVVVGNGISTAEGNLTITPAAGKTFNIGLFNLSIANNPTPISGDLWNDSAQKNLHYFNGIKQAVNGCILTTSSTATVGNTIVETTLIGTPVGTTTLPANFFVSGKTLHFIASGRISSANGANAGNLTVRFKFGSNNLCSTPTTSLVGGLSNRGWRFEGLITCLASGTFNCNGKFEYNSSATATSSWEATTLPATINITATQTINLTAQWSNAHASNVMTCTNFFVNVLN